MNNLRREQLQLTTISAILRIVLERFETSRPVALLLAGQLPGRDPPCHGKR